MSWYWWVLLLVVMYGLGMLGSLYFQKTHPPERRKADRRQGDRRTGRHASPPGGVERRGADRRQGERRKGKPAWQLATVVVSAAFLSIIGVVAYAESQVASIFVGSAPELINSGWADCETPVTHTFVSMGGGSFSFQVNTIEVMNWMFPGMEGNEKLRVTPLNTASGSLAIYRPSPDVIVMHPNFAVPSILLRCP
jgi:hypothetical protein